MDLRVMMGASHFGFDANPKINPEVMWTDQSKERETYA